MNNYTILSKWTNILLIIFVMEVFDMTLKIIHAYHSEVIYIFFTNFLVNEAFDMALSAIIMAGLIIIAFLLRYLLRRYRKYLMEKIESRERHGQTEQELDEVTVKKELVTPPSSRRSLSMPVLTPQRGPFGRDELLVL